MIRNLNLLPWRHIVFSCVLVCTVGCTGVREYFHNGCKVGPDYCPPSAPVANNWIDAADKHVHGECDDLAGWWTAVR